MSAPSYSAFKLINSPTGVEHCCEARLLPHGDGGINLAVAKSSLLEIYTVKKVRDVAGNLKARLNLEHCFPLHGNIVSLHAVRLADRSHDCLLLSFLDAKASLVEIDPLTNDLATVSMHCFESEHKKTSKLTFTKNAVTVMDPGMRCAAMMIYDAQIAIIPLELTESGDVPEDAGPDYGSYVVDVSSLHPNIKNVVDIVFLEGYHEPTLLILYSQHIMFEGKSLSRREETSVVAVSLNLSQRLNPVIWEAEQLPPSAFSLQALPEPIGGALVYATNTIVHVGLDGASGVNVNGFSSFEPQDLPYVVDDMCSLAIALTSSRATVLDNDAVLISLHTGELYLLTLLNDGRRVHLKIRKTGAAALPSCLCTLRTCDARYFFLGSRLGDSLLVQFEERSSVLPETTDVIEPTAKRLRRSPTPMSEDEDEEDALIYGSSAAASAARPARATQKKDMMSSTGQDYKFTVCDMLLNMGPVADLIISDAMDSDGTVLQFNDGTALDLVAASGYGKSGALVVAQTGVRPEVDTGYDLPEVLALWTVRHVTPALAAAAAAEKERRKERHAARAARRAQAKAQDADDSATKNTVAVSPSVPVRAAIPGLPGMGSAVSNAEDDDGGGDQAGSATIKKEDVTGDIDDDDDDELYGGTAASVDKKDAEIEVDEKTRKRKREEDPSPTAGSTEDQDFSKNGTEDVKLESNTVEDGNEDDEEEEVTVDPSWHAYLLLAKEDGTMAFSTTTDLQEVTDNVEFFVDGPTVTAANVCDNYRVVQVFPGGVLLLDGATRKQLIKVEDIEGPVHEVSNSIVDACVCDPFVTVTFSDDRVAVLRVDEGGNTLSIVVPPSLLGSTKAVCLLRDDCGVSLGPRGVRESKVVSAVEASASREEGVAEPSANVGGQEAGQGVEELSDDDMELYGVSSKKEETVASAVPAGAVASDDQAVMLDAEDDNDSAKPHFLVLARASGAVEWFDLSAVSRATTLEDWASSPALSLPNFSSNPELLVHSTEAASATEDPCVVDIYAYVLAGKAYVFAFTADDDLVVYQAFHCPAVPSSLEGPSHGLPVRLRKVRLPVFTRGHMTGRTSPQGVRLPRVTYFDNVNDREGVFVTGKLPLWFLCDRQYLRVFPQQCEKTVNCFAPFHNMNCDKAFIYYDSREVFKIASLPFEVSFHGEVPMRKVPLGGTPRMLAFHKSCKAHIVVVQTSVPVTEEEAAKRDDERVEWEQRDHDREKDRGPVQRVPDNRPLVYADHFEVRLMVSENWEIVDKFELRRYEHVMDCRTMMLKAGKTTDKRKEFLCVSTAVVTQEEKQCAGRILLYDVTEVNAEPGKPWTNRKLKQLVSKEVRGPATRVCEVNGIVLATVGNKALGFEYNPDEDKLEERTFHDLQIFPCTLNVVKNLVIIGDMFKSLWLMFFRAKGHQLVLLSKDYHDKNIFATDFVVDGRNLQTLVADDDCNIQVYALQPENVQSRGGKMLIRVADFHVGSHINRFVRALLPNAWVPSLSVKPAHGGNKSRSKVQTHQGNFFGTANGAVGGVIPVDEAAYKRLALLEGKLTLAIPPYAGLNTRAFREYRVKKPVVGPVRRSILDGELLWRYNALDRQQQRDLARRIGSSPNVILRNLDAMQHGVRGQFR